MLNYSFSSVKKLHRKRQMIVICKIEKILMRWAEKIYFRVFYMFFSVHRYGFKSHCFFSFS